MSATEIVAKQADAARKSRRRRRWPMYLLMCFLVVVFAFPILFMIVSSLKPDDQIFADLKGVNAFLPVGDISLDNYRGVFERVPAMRFMLNTIFIAAMVVGLGLIVNSMAGFALSRMQWRGRKVALSMIIATLVVPFETIAVPMVYWVNQLPWLEFNDLMPSVETGWLNTYRVQIIPFIANAFSIFLFAQYFKSIPKEIDEAARVDGAGWFTIYRKIIVPLSGPAFATVAILTFMPIWNSFLWPIMVTQQEDIRPVQAGVAYFFQNLDTAWGEIMAYTTFITIPVLVFFIAFQRAFIGSIASTGVKG